MANTFNHNDKVVITDGGSVGIGTTSPSRKLEVQGDFYANGTNGALTTELSQSNLYLLNLTRSTTSLITAGSVGIGTTSPDVKLHVNSAGTLNSQEIVLGLSSTSQRPMIQFSESAVVATGNGMSIEYDGRLSSGNNKMYINGVDNSPKLTVMAGGNVGIGTTSPAKKLVVAASSQTWGGAPQIAFYDTTSGQTEARNWTVGAISTSWGNFTIASSTAAGGDPTLARLTITNAGNVGIGTTSPTALLDVRGIAKVGNGNEAGDNDFAFTVAHDNYRTDVYSATMLVRDNRAYNSTNNGGGIIFGGLYNSTNDIAWWGKIKTTKDNTTDGDYSAHMSFFTRASSGNVVERLRITSAGNVGIGTTSPAEKLSVVGNISVTSGQYRLYNNSTVLSASSTTLLEINSGGFSNVSISNGNVGIGTTSPSQKLHVYNGEAIIATSTDGIKLSYSVGNSSGIIDTAFSDNNLEFRTNGSTKMWIANGGNVGIGTTSPSYKLQVNGTAYINETLYVNGETTFDGTSNFNTNIVNASAPYASGDEYIKITNPNDNSGTLMVANNGNTWLNADGGKDLWLNWYSLNSASSKADLRVGDGYGGTLMSVIGSSGNVGIGTTSPNSRLNVKSSGSNTDEITLTHSGNTVNIVAIGQESSHGSLLLRANSGVSKIRLSAAGNNSYILDSNVGIGTTSPDATLTIKTGSSAGLAKISSDGNGAIYSANGDVQFYTNNSAYAINFFSANKGSNLMRITDAGNVGIGTTSPSKKLDVRGGYFVTSDGGSNQVAFVQGGNGYAYFGNLNSGPVAIGNSENYRTIVVDGDKVGIGTSSPATKLNIDIGSGGTNGIAGLRIGGTNNYPSLELGIYGAYGGMVRSFGNDIHYFAGHWQTIGNTASENHSHYWYTSKNGSSDWSTVKMELDHDGNLGIGTTSPNEKLQIAGNVNAYAPGGIDAGLFASTSAGSTTIALRSNGITHLNGGNVGIGTTSPSAALHVYKDQNEPFIVESPNANTWMNLVSTAGNWSMGAASGNKWIVYQRGGTNASRMTIDSSGNVGIGTTSPSEKLHVNSGSGNVPALFQSTDGLSLIIFKDNSTTTTVGVGAAANNIVFYSASERMRIDGSGNVGIGTTSPAYKLDVSGGAIAIRGNAAGNSLRFDDSLGNSRNAMYVDTSNYLNIGNANYAGVKFVQTASAPNTGAFDGQSVQQAVGTTDDGVVLAAPDAWLAVRVGTTDYAIPMYTTG